MNIKNKMLKMPVWKAAICILIFGISFSILIEEILIHTVFHVFDRMIVRMENAKKDDVADMDDMDKAEQRDNCREYKELLDEKEQFVKSSPTDNFDDNFNADLIKEHQWKIDFAIKNHALNLKLCKEAIKSKSL
jgi:hypothetical protein